ncbi:hypothetical protein IscW_ISCW004988 [Ixodes scapularis]|uniref:Uncharacterized protein n=1 Tax=Ixodes scapularis TaxID=6945 RepID=B7PFW1_IXOSC|nr:hypothetical protein IscW_ISCW004988 [Ixodes scapularis]|eukprot:XP_002434083.1 hypothetical protein IscW_ISCW004988 [Ixodes scapularis]
MLGKVDPSRVRDAGSTFQAPTELLPKQQHDAGVGKSARPSRSLAVKRRSSRVPRRCRRDRGGDEALFASAECSGAFGGMGGEFWALTAAPPGRTRIKICGVEGGRPLGDDGRHGNKARERRRRTPTRPATRARRKHGPATCSRKARERPKGARTL